MNPGWLLVVALGLGACSAPHGPGTVEGLVSGEGKSISGALVQAYTRAEIDPSTPPAGETPSGEDGRYRLELPPGRYWLWARATVSDASRDRRLTGPYAANPVVIAPGKKVRAPIALTDPSGFSRSAGPAGTGVRGRVAGAPAREVTVYAYLGDLDRPTGPGFVAAVTPSEEGSFRIDLTPERYTVAARWRATGEDFGAVADTDRVAQARARVVPDGYLDLGTLRLAPVDAVRWAHTLRASPTTDTWIAGRAVDPDDKPAVGVWVLAFTDPRMAGKPVALSEATGADGRFRVYLPGGGQYYLGARSRVGGPAEPGEKVGTWRGEDNGGQVVAPGAHHQGVRIEVEEIW